MIVVALCHTCRHQHRIDFDPARPSAAFSDWITKHPGPLHLTEFRNPRRSGKDRQERNKRRWEHYLHNADVKTAYAASAAPTLTLASLAASSTLLAGRESTLVDNSSNKYLDYLVAGQYRAAATNLQAGTIATAVVGPRDDGGGTAVWPDVFDGTDSAETVTVQAMYDQVCKVISAITTDATQRTWPFGPVGIAQFFGGICPYKFVYFVSHNAHTSTNAWSSTEGDHAVKHTGIFATVA